MNKKIKIIVAAIFAIVLAGGIFYLWVEYEDNNKGMIGLDMKLEEKNGENFYVSKEAGFSIKQFPGWTAEYHFGKLIIKSPDYVLDEDTAFTPVKGCVFTLLAERSNYLEPNEGFIKVKNLIDNYDKADESSKANSSLISVSGKKAIKFVAEDNGIEGKEGKNIFVDMVSHRNLYSFRGWLFGQDRDKCEQDFGKFLETVSIK